MFLMQSIRRGSVALLFGFGMTVLAQAGVQTDRPLEARRDALNKLLAEQWEYQLKESPDWATIYGDLRYNDKMSD